MSPCLPSSARDSFTGNNYHQPATRDTPALSDIHEKRASDKNKLENPIEIQVSTAVTHASDNSNEGLKSEKARQELVCGEEEGPPAKKCRPSVEVRVISEQREEDSSSDRFRLSIAETIKLRERNSSFRYHESESDFFSTRFEPYLGRQLTQKEKRSPSRHSSQPYNIKKSRNGGNCFNVFKNICLILCLMLQVTWSSLINSILQSQTQTTQRKLFVTQAKIFP